MQEKEREERGMRKEEREKGMEVNKAFAVDLCSRSRFMGMFMAMVMGGGGKTPQWSCWR